jgi:tetratricopeptide (TPR) repeat protein
VLGDLARAKAIPQEAIAGGRSEQSTCERCGKGVRRVIFTIAGAGDQIEVWRQYPLAVDGWVCPNCGWAAMPRFISMEESVEFGRIAAEHARKGQFDDAEFWFRRIIGSWHGYAAGYADLGQLSIARSEASKDVEDKRRYRREAEAWLRRAAVADPDRRLAAARLPLARMIALGGNEHEALEVLASMLADPALDATLRDEAEQLDQNIRSGKALFTRATEIAQAVALDAVEAPIDKKMRENLEEGRALLREANEREATFATSWFLGKVELRLGDREAALAAFRRAHAIQPDQPDGCRELCHAYLELDRAVDALPIARRALDLRPADAGLRSNVALVLLLAGDVEQARQEVSAALAADPEDQVTRGLARMIEDVVAGRRARPRSIAEAEGRKR